MCLVPYRLWLTLRWPVLFAAVVGVMWYATSHMWAFNTIVTLFMLYVITMFVASTHKGWIRLYKYIRRFIQWLFIEPFRR